MLCFWIFVAVWVGWFTRGWNAAPVIGILVNLNLIFFYGAPLQAICKLVVNDGHSNSIHQPTLYMNCTNALFWVSCGLSKMDFVVVVPNAIGLTLGLVQAILCCCYPQMTWINNLDGTEDEAKKMRADGIFCTTAIKTCMATTSVTTTASATKTVMQQEEHEQDYCYVQWPDGDDPHHKNRTKHKRSITNNPKDVDNAGLL
ncbi:hypothetical protein ACA910_013423 [Epithemia clementina (nom. ined.)]